MVSAVAGPWSKLAGWVVSLLCINGLKILFSPCRSSISGPIHNFTK